MNRQGFFEELFRDIEYFEQTEKDEIRSYYEELIMDGMEAGVTEEEVIQRLDSPNDIANRLKSEYAHGEGKNAKTAQKEQGVYLPQGKVNTVKVQAEDRGIHLVESRDDQLRICYEAQDDDEIIFYEADGMFYFKQKQRSRFNFLKFRIQTTVAPIIVEIPQNQMKLVELTTKNGGIRCMQVAIASHFLLKHLMEEFDLSRCKLMQLTFTPRMLVSSFKVCWQIDAVRNQRTVQLRLITVKCASN